MEKKQLYKNKSLKHKCSQQLDMGESQLKNNR